MKIFISYSYKDSEIANLIKEKLLIANHSVIQIDTESRIGDNIAINIDNAIHNSDAYIIILSKSYGNSKWAGLELMMVYDQTFGNKTNKRILPVLLDKSVKIPTLLKNVTYADLTNKSELTKNIDRLINSLTNAADSIDNYEYKKIRHLLKEQENLLKVEKNEYLLQSKRQQRLKKSFRLSFLIISIISGLISIVFLSIRLFNRYNPINLFSL
jgi:hypothetical protein